MPERPLAGCRDASTTRRSSACSRTLSATCGGIGSCRAYVRLKRAVPCESERRSTAYRPISISGHLGPYERAPAARLLGADDPAAPPGQVAHHGAHVVVGDQHRHLGHRLQEMDPGVGGRLAQRERARRLERGVGGVHRVRLAVEQRDPYVDERMAGGHARGRPGPVRPSPRTG